MKEDVLGDEAVKQLRGQEVGYLISPISKSPKRMVGVVEESGAVSQAYKSSTTVP